MLYVLNNMKPFVDPKAYIAPTADLIGAVTLEAGASVWFHAVVRADDAPITIGRNSNIQDGVVIHGEKNTPVIISERVTIGHRAIIHASTIGSGSLIGMGAIILSRCQIGANCLIAAGALVPEGTIVPPGSVIMGSPGRIVKTLSEKLMQRLEEGSIHYTEMVDFYQKHCSSLI